MQDRDSREALLFAIGHEVANFLGAIRLQAHLLDEELGARGLAESAIEIDDLAGRAGPMLALMRAILQPEPARPEGRSWAGLLEILRQQLDDEGTRGVPFEIAMPEVCKSAAPGVDWLSNLLQTLIASTLALLEAGDLLQIRLEEAPGESRVVIEDAGQEEDLAEGVAQRGRPLALAIARALLGDIGGSVRTQRIGPTTRVELVFPNPA